MIEFQNVSFRYANSESGALERLSLSVGNGECILLCGESGCGKTTVTRLVNGLIPHYYEGELSGQVLVGGVDVATTELYELSHHVGSVFQNPRSQFFCVDTTSELAFGCENIGLPEEVVRDRIAESARDLNMEKLMGRNIFELSGGEKQKVACASVAAMRPEVFVLDEPTSNLDIDAIEELKKTLKLWKAQGKTIIIAEHRLYWLREICDRVIYMKDGRVQLDITMETLFSYSPQQIAALGLRSLAPVEAELAPLSFTEKGTLELRDFHLAYDRFTALSIDTLNLPVGGIIAVIGHNGAGKSTFSRCLCGLEKKFKGSVVYDGVTYRRKQLLKKSYMVMKDINHQLFCESVDDEVRLGIDEENAADAAGVLKSLTIDTLAQRHPMSLSGGQKQRVAIASAILANKEILLFDEPTSGLDYFHMEQTAKLLASLRGRKTVLIITHDPELILRCCTHVLHLENGVVLEHYRLDCENLPQFRCFFSGCQTENISVRMEPNTAPSERKSPPQSRIISN